MYLTRVLAAGLSTAALVACASTPSSSHGEALAARQATWIVGQAVNTTSGLITGHAAKNATGVSEYLGIPFAAPPVGNLRFQPPNAQVPANTGPRGATFGPACQSVGLGAPPPAGAAGSNASAAAAPPAMAFPPNLTPAGQALLIAMGAMPAVSEDCLYLNVWTAPQVGEQKKAVMVWFHGGGFTGGTASTAFFTGEFFTDEQDVVIVTVNYRLGIFGFPGNPDGANNLGLLDQRRAVEWVRDNIANFGGDPERITLFGQSAGSASVDYYSFAWTQDPIAKGFIMQSGTVLGIPGQTKEATTPIWLAAARIVGCNPANSMTNSPAITACMQTAPADAILAASNMVASNPANPATGFGAMGATFGPVIDNTVVFADYTTRTPIKAGVLLGNNDNEPGFAAVFMPTMVAAANTQQELAVFNCPSAQRALLSINQGNPTWRYRWFGVFPNTALSFNPPSGAYHVSEVPVEFGTVPQTVFGNTIEETSIGKGLRQAWTTFAKNPTQSLIVSSAGSWPQYSPTAKTLAQIGLNNNTVALLAPGNMFDVGCNTLVTAGTAAGGAPAGGAPVATGGAGGSGGIAGTVLVAGAGRSWAYSLGAVAMGLVVALGMLLN